MEQTATLRSNMTSPNPSKGGTDRTTHNTHAHTQATTLRPRVTNLWYLKGHLMNRNLSRDRRDRKWIVRRPKRVRHTAANWHALHLLLWLLPNMKVPVKPDIIVKGMKSMHIRRLEVARLKSKMYVGSLYRCCHRILTRMRTLLGTPTRMKHKVKTALASAVSLLSVPLVSQ